MVLNLCVFSVVIIFLKGCLMNIYLVCRLLYNVFVILILKLVILLLGVSILNGGYLLFILKLIVFIV